MKKQLTIIIVLLFSLSPWPNVSAQETVIENPVTDEVVVANTESSQDGNNAKEEEIIEATPLAASAGKDKNGVVGRNIVFDASGSTGPTDEKLIYTWDFGDGEQFVGIDASHIYAEPGTYKARITVTDGEKVSKDTLLVSIAKDVVLLITDNSVSKDDLKKLKDYAQRHGTLLVSVKPTNENDPNYALSRNIAEQLVTSEEDLAQANLIITWTGKNIGLNALSEVGRIFTSSNGDVATSSASFSQKAIVRIDDKTAGSALARLAQSTFNIITPQYVLLTTTPALEIILANPSADTLTSSLQSNNIDYQIIGRHSQRVLDTISPFNFFSYGINYLINQGVSPDTLFLLLILPIVATIIAFGRQIVGVKAFGIYVPSIIALTFVVTQLKYGLVLFLLLLVVATVSRLLVRYLRILYMPRMAIVLTIVSLSIFIMFIAASYLGRSSIVTISIFPILVMIILTEKFVEAQIEQGNRTAIVLTIETLVLAIISYGIVTWGVFETFIMAYPEAVLLTLVLNFVFGRFTGLRLFEYIRFRKLFKKPSA
ncbi:MAG: 7TM domain-containing protein [bacterium]|nr:7TM domain-containing protein [bacterium]